jgi:VanZ family protein
VVAAAAGPLLLSARRMIAFLRYGLPLLIGMLIIFGASADAQSTAHTSRFLEPFLRWLNPDISTEAIDAVRWLVRKAAHMTEYALLAWLWWRALRRPVRNDPRPWSWKIAGAAWALTILYAASDEFHQTFVANRTGSVVDVGIDSAGAALGLGLLWLRYRRRRG